MDEIIIIRALDSDGSSFKKIIDALHEIIFVWLK